MCADFLRLLFILDSGCPGMVTGAHVEIEMVVKMVVGGGCKSGLTQFEGAVGEGGCIGAVVPSGVGMSAGGSGTGNRGSAVISGGVGPCVASGGAS